MNGAFHQVPQQQAYQVSGLPPQQQFNPNMTNQPFPSQNGFQTSNLNTKSPSPYEQQELAIREAKMLQELQELKQRKDTDGGMRGAFEEGRVSKSKRGKFARAMGKVGSLVKKGAVAAAPAGAAVGTLFIMRAAFGPPATFMPVATPTGTAFVPMSR